MTRLISLLFLSASVVAAQDRSPEKVTVPLQDPSRPARIQVHLVIGGITVQGYDGKDVLVEAHARLEKDDHRLRTPNPRAEGMRRIDLPGDPGLDIEEENNVVNVRTSRPNRGVDLVITVPRHSSLELKSVNDGKITVEHVEGEIDAEDINGGITLRNVSGSVVAHSINGGILATLDRVNSSKPMSFSTLNGDIDVTLPPDIRANVKMKSDHGEILSDFDVHLNMTPAATEGSRGQDGKFRLRNEGGLRGTIAGGGPDYQFTTFNGTIYIRKHK